MSNHQPLEKIHLKNLPGAPIRLQKLLLKMQPFDFEIKYILGKEVALTDALIIVIPYEKIEITGLDFTIHELTLCMTLVQIFIICDELKKDLTIQLLIQQMLQGWTSHYKEVDLVLSKYWYLREELSIEDGCKGYLGRLVIPSSLRKSGHQGMSQMYLRECRLCIGLVEIKRLGTKQEIVNHARL